MSASVHPHDDHTVETTTAESPRPAAQGPTLGLVIAFARGHFHGDATALIPSEGLVLGRRSALFEGALDDPQVSREHAQLGWERGRLVLRDRASRNGSHVNGALLRGERVLARGDVVRLGHVLFIVGETQQPTDGDEGLAGSSAAIEAVRRSIRAVATRDSAVLVTGETGVGKELVARALHARSGRRGPFLAVNCGGLAEGVLESELFGHVRGAFSGAANPREGLLRAADGGTLLLDELGEMPAALQVRLLRALETRRVRPVGAEQEVAIDARVVAATHRDVVGEVLRGAFRSDLYARIAPWTIHVPPLRERREDIACIARSLLERLGAHERPVEWAFAEQLLLHPFPLNVRGLLNALTAALIARPDGGALRVTPEVEAALAAERRLAQGSSPETPAVSVPPEPSSRDALESALREARGNVAEAARRLGCSRQQLYRRIAASGIDPESFREG
ncbi:MAG: sigma 54-interacting transcriptional regulator [Polyangiales bacterium]